MTQLTPPDADIELGDLFTPDDADFVVVRAQSEEQRAAQLALSRAVVGFEKAFGTVHTLQQLGLMAAVTRDIVRRRRAQDRILAARAGINAEAAAVRAAGDEDLARVIERRATPDYPERLQDAVLLGEPEDWDGRHAELEGVDVLTDGADAPVWLRREADATGLLLVGCGEGAVKGVLNQWIARRPGAVSALVMPSLLAFNGGLQRDAYGRVDPKSPRPDTSRPAMTTPWTGEVVLLLSHKLPPVNVRMRKPQGGTFERDLTVTERMEISGTLAAHWWRLAGARSVKAAKPPIGMDYLDYIAAPRVAA